MASPHTLLTDGTHDVILCSSEGKAIRFNEDDVRAMGRNAAGVRGIRMPDGERVISLIIPDSDRLTRSTSAAWSSIDRLRWMTPMPP